MPPMTCVFIFAFAMIVGAISVLPGGLGSTEATMAGLLVLQGMTAAGRDRGDGRGAGDHALVRGGAGHAGAAGGVAPCRQGAWLWSA